MAGLVRNTPGSVGYLEFTLVVQSKPTIPFATLKNRAGRSIRPTFAGITAAIDAGVGRLARDLRNPVVDGSGPESYPLCGLTYLLVPSHPGDAAKGRKLVEFLRWSMGPGQKMAEERLYAALPPSVCALNLKRLAECRAAP